MYDFLMLEIKRFLGSNCRSTKKSNPFIERILLLYCDDLQFTCNFNINSHPDFFSPLITFFLFLFFCFSNMFTVFLLSIYTIYYYYKYSKRKNPLPGPLPLPFVGNSYQLGFLTGDKISSEFIDELFSLYGDMFETYSFNERIIWVNRIELAEKFLNVSMTNSDNIDEKKLENKEKLEYNYFYLRNKNEIKELRINEMGIYYNHEYSSWKFHRNALIK